MNHSAILSLEACESLEGDAKQQQEEQANAILNFTKILKSALHNTFRCTHINQTHHIERNQIKSNQVFIYCTSPTLSYPPRMTGIERELQVLDLPCSQATAVCFISPVEQRLTRPIVQCRIASHHITSCGECTAIAFLFPFLSFLPPPPSQSFFLSY